MSVSRRKLLHHSIFAGIAYAASPLLTWAGKKKSSDSSPEEAAANNTLEHLTRADFNGAIGSGFQVTPSTGKSSPVWLRLLAVDDLPALVPVNTASMDVPPKQTSSPVHTDGFMLVFLGTLPQPLDQGTYTFDHPVLGKFSLLIVPNGQESQTYTAVINRL